jgi:ABC-type transport system involved in multi-copper enzyme maturation permease subunit
MLEAYRELNSKKLFWITMIISALVVLVFLAVDLGETGLTFFGWKLGFGPSALSMDEEVFFKRMFIQFGIAIWLAWIATVLALATTAEIFPNLMGHGAIDMVLSKPIGRLQLFAMKFASGLLFTGLQVAVFCGASFLVIGIKTGAWELGIFLAVPVMIVFFSYLFAACVLFGVLTRSTIASLLLTLLVWFAIFIGNSAETGLLSFMTMQEQRLESIDTRIERQAMIVAAAERRALGQPDNEQYAERVVQARTLAEDLEEERADAAEDLASITKWHRITFMVKTGLPKTGETIALLERWLISAADLQPTPEPSDEAMAAAEADGAEQPPPSMWNFELDEEQLEADLQTELRGRSVAWIVGTSLLFELALLSIAAWRFHRRDF